jgi:hypothetical protein
VWLIRTNQGDAETPCRHGKNCRLSVSDCDDSGTAMSGGDILGRALNADPLFQGT